MMNHFLFCIDNPTTHYRGRTRTWHWMPKEDHQGNPFETLFPGLPLKPVHYQNGKERKTHPVQVMAITGRFYMQ